MQPLTQQELGLHLIARYLLTPDYYIPAVDHMIDKLRGAYGINRIDNLSYSNSGAYIMWDFRICTNCKLGIKDKASSIATECCSNCSNSGDIINYHIVTKSQQLNADIAFIPYEYKLKLSEILWQTYLRKLL